MTGTFTILYRMLIFFFILFLIDLYVYQGVKTAFSTYSARTRSIAAWTYWGISATFMLLSAYIFFQAGRITGPSDPMVKLFAGSFVLLYMPKLLVVIFLLGEDVWRLLRGTGVGIYKLTGAEGAADISFFDSRRRFISQAAGIVASIPVLGILYGVTKGKYNFKVRKVELAFKDLPAAFDGFTITQISDIHSGSFDDRKEVMHAVKLANEQGSDIMFFTGDLVNNHAEEMEPWVDVFSELKAPMGKYSILGNHDYGDYAKWDTEAEKKANMERLFKMHERIGFTLMKNENTKIERNGESIELLGLENWGAGGFTKYGDLTKTLEGTAADSFKILMSHDPSHWEHQVMDHSQHIHLTLSGHTHGMQFGIEIPGFRFSPVQLRYPRWAGLYKENERYLYVNRGLGFLAFPGRVGIWPEITVITLKRQA